MKISRDLEGITPLEQLFIAIILGTVLGTLAWVGSPEPRNPLKIPTASPRPYTTETTTVASVSSETSFLKRVWDEDDEVFDKYFSDVEMTPSEKEFLEIFRDAIRGLKRLLEDYWYLPSQEDNKPL